MNCEHFLYIHILIISIEMGGNKKGEITFDSTFTIEMELESA